MAIISMQWPRRWPIYLFVMAHHFDILASTLMTWQNGRDVMGRYQENTYAVSP